MIPNIPEAEPRHPTESSFGPNGPPLLRRAEAEAEVDGARPGLPEDSDERRAAVLLLLTHDGGLNIDRLVARTKYPRDFVARCVRRLVDNGWLADGEARYDWSSSGAACQPFWSDVAVALGRLLRRTSDDGRLEWAPVGGWVKHFEYSAPPAREGEVGNHDREIPAYDPEPEAPVVEAQEEPSAGESGPPARERSRSRVAPPSVQMPRVRRPELDRSTTAPLQGGMLVDGWGAAEWLG
jgi:hypothetical protein